MSTKTKPTIKNDLRQVRKRRGLERKQVALLLTQKSTKEIYRYENGVNLPSLRIALQLEAIYQMPIKLMFSALFEQCRDEIAELKKSHPQLFPDKNWFPKQSEQLTREEFCFYSDVLQSRIPNMLELEMVDKHVVNLMKTTSDFRNGRRPFSQ